MLLSHDNGFAHALADFVYRRRGSLRCEGLGGTIRSARERCGQRWTWSRTHCVNCVR